MTPAEFVCRAAARLGGKAELARLLVVKRPTVSQWCSGVRPVPPARAIDIERLTDGAVSRFNLCPDFPWAAFANSSADREETVLPESRPGQGAVSAVNSYSASEVSHG